MKIAAVGDLHIKESAKGTLQDFFDSICQKAEILILAGDLTSQGQINEAKTLVDELSVCTIPILAVLGNHDYENGKQEEIKKLLLQNEIIVLDGDVYTTDGVGFAGVKGFCGGFDNHMMPSWGEEVNKKFVLESINEALKLERALINLQTKRKVAILHYSPIHQTVEGEAEEIIPFLGSSRLAEPIDNFGAEIAIHGHSHFGKPQGKTNKGIPVYNVSLALLKHINPKQPYLLIDV
jgi:Icc-related predicted phosphoesterase